VGRRCEALWPSVLVTAQALLFIRALAGCPHTSFTTKFPLHARTYKICQTAVSKRIQPATTQTTAGQNACNEKLHSQCNIVSFLITSTTKGLDRVHLMILSRHATCSTSSLANQHSCHQKHCMVREDSAWLVLLVLLPFQQTSEGL
jgi:hypothetical protein